MRRWLLLGSILGCLYTTEAQTPPECQAHRRRGRRAEARTCFEKLVASPNTYHRAEGYWGLRFYEEANRNFRAAIDQAPQNPDYRVRWGRLFLERFNKEEAAKLFQEALGIDEKHAGALVGMALVASEGFERKAVELAEKATQSDPKLVEARELLARLALEDANPEKAAAEADKALELSAEALDAMAIRATIDWLQDRPDSPWMERLLKIHPYYGDAYETAAHLFMLNRRYEEAIRFYRKALELDPELWTARAQLGINLMRLGEEKEAQEHLERCYENGHRDAATVNTLRLLESYKNFLTYTGPQTVLKLHKKEADLLRPYMEGELQRAIVTFEKKYRMKLERPVQLEVYPDHEDFAVRTMGMPGLGALGVTFGYVVAMDSPSGRPPGSFHWASTLWHELSHVFVLTATRHRVPRWFTEGMAVHEETAVSPEWGDRMTPDILGAVREKKLLAVAQLDRGFVRPSYPAQVMVSYFQAGRICDYIAERWGFARLLEMMRAFGAGKTTPQVVEAQLGLKPEEFDRDFLTWVERGTLKVAESLAEWRKRARALAEAARTKKYDEVIRDGPAVRDQYPDYVEQGSIYELLAEARLAGNDKPAAMAELERYTRAGGRSPATLKKLAGFQEEAGRAREAAATLDRLNYIYPVNDEELHRRLGALWLAQGNLDGAIRELRAAVASKPVDPASAHYELARALVAARRPADARDHLLQSLEAAPGYRPAQKLLLQLHSTEKEKP